MIFFFCLLLPTLYFCACVPPSGSVREKFQKCCHNFCIMSVEKCSCSSRALRTSSCKKQTIFMLEEKFLTRSRRKKVGEKDRECEWSFELDEMKGNINLSFLVIYCIIHRGGKFAHRLQAASVCVMCVCICTIWNGAFSFFVECHSSFRIFGANIHTRYNALQRSTNVI